MVIDHLQTKFLSILLRIRTHARNCFRHIRCSFRKADFIAEVIALAWKWFVRLAERGKDACRFPSILATFAAKAVRCGRRVTGQLRPKDVLSAGAQQRHGFSVSKLPDFTMLNENPLQEALIDNTRSPIPDQVHFRLDFPAWTTSRCRRDRNMIRDIATGERTGVLAHRYGLSAPRVSQLRREFHDDWQRFTGDESVAEASA